MSCNITHCHYASLSIAYLKKTIVATDTKQQKQQHPTSEVFPRLTQMVKQRSMGVIQNVINYMLAITNKINKKSSQINKKRKDQIIARLISSQPVFMSGMGIESRHRDRVDRNQRLSNSIAFFTAN